MGRQLNVRSHLRRVPGTRRKIRVRAFRRRRRVDIKLRGKGR